MGPHGTIPPVFRVSAHYPNLGEILLPGASGGRTPGNLRKTNTRVCAHCRATSGPLASQQGEREARAARPLSSCRGRRPPALFEPGSTVGAATWPREEAASASAETATHAARAAGRRVAHRAPSPPRRSLGDVARLRRRLSTPATPEGTRIGKNRLSAMLHQGTTSPTSRRLPHDNREQDE